ncbi:hypothetical protein KP509_26G035700 [Ceratopteris richardii]|uniref:Uncharacterized protein n=1 Tax=Ceratopteris richardii TaxID=49495 RepID=A0A8T2RLL8_CERRI|nr:hypothetical protein KP509_26G035700 [Ceratopteris richardii]KAH7296713.1 hypothetical protein KP509_26G035700 [Ceratopteris richardii]KAH7296714.1 hypothetical protein KP509_26G035700 [Ceratopteris richardii]KAH7296715.1 hypothetical protein KP509_26G035700 [Ceratopteris richardii]KAH7296716.1 hypothetical protein KP509_26G035700 [Ceratopteris richardii]
MAIALGRFDETFQVASLRAYVAEFVSTLLFVFAGVGSVLAFGALDSGDLSPSGLLAIAVTHAFALFVTVAIAANISGGHVNPAVTFALALGGHITILKAIVYWIAQLLGAVVGCYLLKVSTNGLAPAVHALGSGESALEGVICEIIITFGLVYTVHATAVDPKAGDISKIAPICIGFVVGANILAAGPFSGGSMNPARSFGPAFVSGDWTDHWVYWVGPLVGGAIAAGVFGGVFHSRTHEPIATSDY